MTTTTIQIVRGSKIAVLRFLQLNDEQPEPIPEEGDILMWNDKGQKIIEMPGKQFMYVGWTKEEALEAIRADIRQQEDQIAVQMAARLYSYITNEHVIVIG